MDSPVDFREDGRIALDFDGKPIVLRIPKIREFEILIRYADELDDELEKVKDVGDRLKSSEKEVRDSVTPEDIAEWGRVRRSVASLFVFKSVKILGDKDGPKEIEDYPAWSQDMSLPARFQNHWQTVPLGSSNRSMKQI